MKHLTRSIWPVVGPKRRIIPVDESVVRQVEDFCSPQEFLAVLALLEVLCDGAIPCHPKFAKMHGPNLWELRKFGKRSQGRLYFYRVNLGGFDTLLLCGFLQKKEDSVPAGLEEKLTEAAKRFLSGIRPPRAGGKRKP